MASVSTQRIVNNYFVDFLDYLDILYLENESSMGNVFSNIEDETKKQLIMRFATLLVNLDTLSASETTYWNQIVSSNLTYIISLSFSIIGMTVIIFFLFAQGLQYHKGRPISEIIKFAILYILLYIVIFGVLLMLTVNISNTYSFNKAAKTESVSFLKNLYSTQQSFLALPTVDVELLLYIGYKGNSNDSSAQTYYNLVKRNGQFQSLIPRNSKKQPHIDMIDVYDAIQGNLQTAITKFYADGKGYNNVNLMITLSDNIYTLNEIDTIMNFYYFTLYSSNHPELSEDVNSSNEKIIDSVVVNNFKLLDQTLNDPIRSVDDLDTTSYLYGEILMTYAYLAIDSWNIYNAFKNIAITSDVSNFIQDSSIQNMDVNSNTCATGDTVCAKESYDYNVIAKTTFASFQPDLNGYVSQASSAANYSAASQLIITYQSKYKFLFVGLYQQVLAKMSTIDLFPCKKAFVAQQLQEYFSKNYVLLPSTYVTDFISIVSSNLVMNIFNDINAAIEPTFVDKAATSLAAYSKISLDSYNTYILSKVVDDDNSKLTAEYCTSILTQISNAVSVKQQNAGTSALDDINFIDITGFITVIDSYTYNDLSSGLQIDYYNTLITKYYAKISKGVNSKQITTENIFYYEENKLIVLKIGVVFVSFAIVLVYSYYMTGLFFADRGVKKDGEDIRGVVRSAGIPASVLQYYDRMLNVAIQYAIPTFLTFFIIIFIASAYSNSAVALDFNKEVIEKDTVVLKKAVNDVQKQLARLDTIISDDQQSSRISDIKVFNHDEKTKLYGSLCTIVAAYQKTNFVIAAKGEYEFPYTELIVNLCLTVLIILIIVYVIVQFQPLARLTNIRQLNIMKGSAEFTDNIGSLVRDITALETEQSEEMALIMLTIKGIVCILIAIFVLFYSGKIASSSSALKKGLMNSAYYRDLRTYGGVN